MSFAAKRASFSPHEVEVEGQRQHARHFVIATGSRAAVSTIAGLNRVPFFTNETIFGELHEKPASMMALEQAGERMFAPRKSRTDQFAWSASTSLEAV